MKRVYLDWGVVSNLKKRKHSVNPVFAAWPIRGNFVRKTDKAYVDPQ
jgi:hypothetical protein